MYVWFITIIWPAEKQGVPSNEQDKYDATQDSTKGLTEQQIADRQGGDEDIAPTAENM